MINKQKNNILNTTEQEKKEIEKLFLDADTINPKDLLIKVQDIHKKLILKKDYSLISFILSLNPSIILLLIFIYGIFTFKS